MIYIDSHCHLQYHPLKGEIKAVLEECNARKVTTLVCIGTDLNSSEEAVNFVGKRENISIFASCGIHPTEVNQYGEFPSKEFENILSTVSNDFTPFIGECGLDYFHKTTSQELQIKFFEQHILFAKKHNKILIIHIREAHEDVKNILKNYLPIRFISHCFSGNYEDAKFFLDNGGYISFALNITYPKNNRLLDVMKKIPIERILFETDSPFLPPQCFRGKTNYPYYVVEGYKLASEVLGINVNTLAEKVEDNFNTLINKKSKL